VNAEKAVAEAIRRRGNRPAQPTVDSSDTLGGTPTTDPGTGSSGLFEVEVSDTVQMGWGVQIGAYSNYGGVMRLVSRLKRAYGQPVHVASINRGGRVLYLVIVGAYANINDARDLQRRLRSEFSGAFIKNLRDV
jgi:cell division septation protein DedD